MKEFIDRDFDEQERQVQDQIHLLHEDGITDELDGTNCARILSKWAAALLKEGKPFPPSLAKWLADGLLSTFEGKSLEEELGFKRTRRGPKEQRDKHLEVKVAVAKLVVDKKISLDAAMGLLTAQLADPLNKGEWLSNEILAGDFSSKSGDALTYDGIKKIVYSNKGDDVNTIIEDLKSCVHK